MATINPHTTRATGTILTAAIYNADHQNHISNANALNVDVVDALTDIIDLQFLFGRPTLQIFTATGAGTWNRTAGTKIIIVEGAGGGGGSGAVVAAGDNNSGATGGGSSGFAGRTGPISVIATSTAALVVGTGGTAGVAGGAQGGNGVASSITVGATTYTFPGGYGSPNYTANGSVAGLANAGGPADHGVNTTGYSSAGSIGFHHADVTSSSAVSGFGGSSWLGNGAPNRTGAGPGNQAGQSPFGGYGGGAGGALCTDTASNAAGAAGAQGVIRVWEFG